MPPHNYFAGINLPGGTTDPAAIWAPSSILAPSSITDLSPITTSFPIWQEYSVQFYPIVQFLPIYNLACIPVGRDGAVWRTEFSPMEVNWLISTLLMSPLMTTLYQTEANLLSYTSPIIVADGAIQLFSVRGWISYRGSFILCLEFYSIALTLDEKFLIGIKVFYYINLQIFLYNIFNY